MRISPAIQRIGLAFLFAGVCAAAPPPPILIGPGITPPKLLHAVDPSYTDDALRAGIWGSVAFEMVVDDTGKPTDISLVSPLGYGLDEEAETAVSQWRFSPARKNGKPVSVFAIIQVNFNLRGHAVYIHLEELRTQFNMALPHLKDPDKKRQQKAIETIQKLAKEKFGPAMYLLAQLLQTGEVIPRNSGRADELMDGAAKAHYGPALFQVGSLLYELKTSTGDAENGLRMIEKAAHFGSYRAQLFMGNRFNDGRDIPRDPDRASQYFRLCASMGHTDCEVDLAKLLINTPNRRPHEYLQAIAWLQLATEQGRPEARDLLGKEMPHLTSEQISAAQRLQAKLVHKVEVRP
ncbi:MAG TPA: TonB family protein [Bryobacteraceae bacterium]|nr:TonB family protein [Bryobacteraceae bacterium]